MTTSPGMWSTLKGYGTRSERGTPPTIQFAVGSSLPLSARRLLYSASAHGWNGTSRGFMFAAMSPIRIAAGRQSPTDRFAVRRTGGGRGQIRLPSGARDAGRGCCSHCARRCGHHQCRREGDPEGIHRIRSLRDRGLLFSGPIIPAGTVVSTHLFDSPAGSCS